MYTGDFNTRFPVALRLNGSVWEEIGHEFGCCTKGENANWRRNRNTTTPGKINDGRLAKMVQSYAGDELGIFTCPSLAWDITQTEVDNGYMGLRNGMFVRQNTFWYDGTMLSSLPSPSATGLLCDPICWQANGTQAHMYGTPPDRLGPTLHAGSAINIAFADGHVENSRPGDVYSVFWRNPRQ